MRGWTRILLVGVLIYVPAVWAQEDTMNSLNHDKIKIFVDKNQVDFGVSDTSDSWILTLNYPHSTHQVRIDFLAAPDTVDFLGITLAGWIIVIILVAAVLAILAALVYRKKAKINNA